MTRTPLKSGSIKSAAYSRTTQTLEIEFNSGAIYQYKKVPEGIFQDLMNHREPGKFLHLNIKGIFEVEKMPEDHDMVSNPTS